MVTHSDPRPTPLEKLSIVFVPILLLRPAGTRKDRGHVLFSYSGVNFGNREGLGGYGNLAYTLRALRGSSRRNLLTSRSFGP